MTAPSEPSIASAKELSSHVPGYRRPLMKNVGVTRAPLRCALSTSWRTRACAALNAGSFVASFGGRLNSRAIRPKSPSAKAGPRSIIASWTSQNRPVVSAAYSANSAARIASSLPPTGRCRYTYRMRSPNRLRSPSTTS